MEVYKDSQAISIDYGSDREFYAEVLDCGEIYIEGADARSIPSEVIYAFLDWVQENTPRSVKKYRISYITENYPSYVPENAIIEEIYEEV